MLQVATDTPSDCNVLKYVRIFDVNIHAVNVSELHCLLEDSIARKAHHLYLNVNVYGMNIAFEQAWFRNFLNTSQITFCDGFGINLGGKLLGYTIPERITYADWTWQLAEFAVPRRFTLYFLGGGPGVAEKAAVKLKKRFPTLCVVGARDGYFDKTPGCEANEAVIYQINALSPDILIVGFGMPIQERWLMENWNRIDAHVALTGGAVFDYISGDLRRAPRWMTDHGLEWLGRLLIEPGRLWKRYLIGNPLFLWRVLLQKFGLLRLKD